MTDEKAMTNEVYESVLITFGLGAVGMSMASKKLLKEPLSTPESVKGTVKLVIAVAGSTLLVKYLQDKKYLPVDPFKT